MIKQKMVTRRLYEGRQAVGFVFGSGKNEEIWVDDKALASWLGRYRDRPELCPLKGVKLQYGSIVGADGIKLSELPRQQVNGAHIIRGGDGFNNNFGEDYKTARANEKKWNELRRRYAAAKKAGNEKEAKAAAAECHAFSQSLMNL